jgi:hypothetical protein
MCVRPKECWLSQIFSVSLTLIKNVKSTENRSAFSMTGHGKKSEINIGIFVEQLECGALPLFRHECTVL